MRIAREHARGVLREADVDRQLRAVARGQVAVAARGERLVVDVLARRRRLLGEHGKGLGLVAPVRGADDVSVAGLHAAEQEAALRVRALPRNRPAGCVDERHLRVGRQARHVDLFDAAVRIDRSMGRGRAEDERDSSEENNSPHHLRDSITPGPRGSQFYRRAPRSLSSLIGAMKSR
jgi:hypothetical protein